MAGDCLAARRESYEKFGCITGIYTPVLDVCDTVFQGKLGPGSPCTDSLECDSAPGEAAECNELVPGSEAGVCVVRRRVMEGEPCYWTCTEESGGAWCGGTQVALAVQGSCYTNDQLYCASDGCTPRKATGEQCGSSEECQSNFCNDDECFEGSDIEALTFFCTLLAPL